MLHRKAETESGPARKQSSADSSNLHLVPSFCWVKTSRFGIQLFTVCFPVSWGQWYWRVRCVVVWCSLMLQLGGVGVKTSMKNSRWREQPLEQSHRLCTGHNIPDKNQFVPFQRSAWSWQKDWNLRAPAIWCSLKDFDSLFQLLFLSWSAT